MPSRQAKAAALAAAFSAVSLPGGAPGLAATAASARPAFDPKTLVALDAIEAPIIDSGDLDGVVKVSLRVQMHTPEEAEALSARIPELRAALLAGTMEFARLYGSPFNAVDVARLRAMLTEAAKKVDPQIDTVLILSAGAFMG